MKIPKVFYGYWIVAVLFLCLFILGGCGIYSFSLFVLPLQGEFGWGRGEIMLSYTLFFLIMGIAAPLVGKLIIRYEARKVMAIGASIGGLGFILLTLMQNLWHFYAGYIVIAVGLSASGMVPITTVVSNWFKKRRGTAIGIVTAGIPAGGITLARVIGGYFIPNFGWETSYLVLALITFAIVPLVLIITKTKPADIGLFPDGGSEPKPPSESIIKPSNEGISLKMALATPTFWLMIVSFVIYGFINDGVFQHQVPHLQDIGFPLATAAANLSIWGLGSLFGRMFFGWLCDQIQARYVLGISLGLKLIAIFLLMNLALTSPQQVIWLYAILMGSSMGATVTTSSMLVSNNFGLRFYSVIFGVVSLATSIGSATGPLFMGYMYDIMNTYNLAFIILLVLGIIAIPIALAIHRPSLSSNMVD